jgi:hypothetical protein
MSITGPLMAINDRDKWIKERKQLTHPCAMNHHVTLGVVRKNVFVTCHCYVLHACVHCDTWAVYTI